MHYSIFKKIISLTLILFLFLVPLNGFWFGSNSASANIVPTWTAREAKTDKTLNKVIYANDTFVAVGDSGSILTSKDGEKWDLRSSGTDKNLYSIVYGNNKFIAVGSDGILVTSTDGINWSVRTIEIENIPCSISSITWGKGVFVAISDIGIITSGDGLNWDRNKLVESGFCSAVFISDTFICCGERGKIFTSSDGFTWVERRRNTGIYAMSPLKGIAYGNNKYAVVGSDTGYMSTDQTNWEDIQSSILGNDIAFGNGLFVSVGSSLARTSIFLSKDARLWSQTISPSGCALSVTFGKNRFVAVGEGGTILTGTTISEHEKSVIKLTIDNTKMNVNNRESEIDPGRSTAPKIINGRTLVPVRAIIEALNGSVNWDGAVSKVTLTLNNKKVEMFINNPQMLVDGVKKEIDLGRGTSPKIINGRTMLPIRAVIEEFGGSVEWNANTKSIIIQY